LVDARILCNYEAMYYITKRNMCKNYTVAVRGIEATVLGRQLQGFVSY